MLDTAFNGRSSRTLRMYGYACSAGTNVMILISSRGVINTWTSMTVQYPVTTTKKSSTFHALRK